jgi:release factor glutamine methyltransferase
MPTIGEALADARAALKQALTLDDREAGLEARLLLGHALERPRAYLLAHGNETVAARPFEHFRTLLRRRLAAEPVAYILGQREFFGLDLEVTPDVLIPRPDTELLVESALACLPAQAPCEVLDLGTGSGALAIALAKQRPQARLTAIDRSLAALAVARRNACRLGAAHIRFVASDWFDALAPGQRFDLIVGNPPYVAEDDPHLCSLGHEPRSALVSGRDGLDAIRRIVRDAPRHLRPGGALLLEHGYDQGKACRELFRQSGFGDVETERDLAGLERVTKGVRSSIQG